MEKYLPSKRFALFLLSVIIAVGIIYLFPWLNKLKTVKPTLTGIGSKTQTKVQEFMVLDSDNDGLKDWEEALWKTDPGLADTDKDGTSDGEEIKLVRDPLKQNINPVNQTPSDKIDEQIIIAEKKVQEDFNKLSDTEKVGRLLFSEYLASKKSGAISESEIAYIVEDALASIPPPVFKQYTLNNLATYEATTTTQIENYGKKLIGIILGHQLPTKIDFDAIINSINEEDTVDQITEKLKALQPLVDMYQALALNLLTISVPVQIVHSHLALLNAFARLGDNLSQIQQSAGDPIKMLTLIKAYSENLDTLKTVTDNFFVL